MPSGVCSLSLSLPLSCAFLCLGSLLRQTLPHDCHRASNSSKSQGILMSPVSGQTFLFLCVTAMAQERTQVGPAWIFTHPWNGHSTFRDQRLWEFATLSHLEQGVGAESWANDHHQGGAMRPSGTERKVPESETGNGVLTPIALYSESLGRLLSLSPCSPY